nr:unknown [Populus trichocarpa]
MRPNTDFNIYVFALFNENMKPGPASERNYGLFKPDGTPAYSLGISGTDAVSANTTTTTGAPAPPSPDSSSTGYLSISAAVKERCCSCIGQLLFPLLLLNYLAFRLAF